MPARQVVKLDFNVDAVTYHGVPCSLAKFEKALLRLMRVAVKEKSNLLIIYPHYTCKNFPLLLISNYFTLLDKEGLNSKNMPKVCCLTKNKSTALSMRELSNQYGTYFLDYIPMGYVSRRGFNRVKPTGASRARSGRINEKEANLLFAKPPYLPKQNFDSIFIEDAQFLVKKRYAGLLESLSTLKTPLVLIVTSPDITAVETISMNLKAKVWGWTEELLRKDVSYFNDTQAEHLPELFFPELTVKEIDVRSGAYATNLSFAWTAYSKYRWKVRKFVSTKVDLDRINIEIYLLLKKFTCAIAPFSELEKTELQINHMPLQQRLRLLHARILTLEPTIRNTLEMETIVNLLSSLISMEPAKYELLKAMYLEKPEKNLCFSTEDLVNQITLERLFPFANKMRPSDPTDNLASNRPIDLHLITSYTGCIERLYKQVKSVQTAKCMLLAYDTEHRSLDRFLKSKDAIKKILDQRLSVVKSLHLDNYTK